MFIGVVGKPSSGKSTFFKAATLSEVDIANYPFTTIKPNEAVGFVKTDCAETFFKTKCNPKQGYCIKGKRFVPVKLLDVAGLVPGAHQGVGLGLQFLDDLSAADVLVHVIDISGSINEKGEPVEAGSYDPIKDIDFLEHELDMWYIGIFKKGWNKFVRLMGHDSGDSDKAIASQFSGLKVTLRMVKDSLNKLSLKEKPLDKWDDADIEKFAKELRALSKPTIIAANKIDLPSSKANLIRLQQKYPNYIVIPCSAESELALKEATKKGLIDYTPGDTDFQILDESKLSDKQKQALEIIKEKVLKEHGSTGIQAVLDKAVFELLNYIVIFPGGSKKLEDSDGNTLPDAWLLPPSSTALDFAYRIHRDLGDTFVRAIDVKTKMTVGKEHKLKNGDVIEIISIK